MGMNHKTVIAVSDAATLKYAASGLHDARFTLDAIEFNAGERRFQLTCWTAVLGKASFMRRRPIVGWKAWELIVTDVESYNLEAKETVSYYVISTLDYSEKNRELTVMTHYAVSVLLRISRLSAILKETGQMREQWP